MACGRGAYERTVEVIDSHFLGADHVDAACGKKDLGIALGVDDFVNSRNEGLVENDCKGLIHVFAGCRVDLIEYAAEGLAVGACAAYAED